MQRPTAAAEPADPGSAAPVLEARDLVKRFGERVALRSVTIEARRGELVAVIGPNGAGKTTLLSILAGTQRADSGTISRARGEIGWVPQQAALYGKLTVAENLRLFARLERHDDPNATVDRMLEQTGLRDRADDQVQTLSGGNRQRVNIAIGLLSDLQILRRSPLLVAMLVLYPILIAALVGFAVTSGPSKPRVALLNEVPEAQNEINVGGERVNVEDEAQPLFDAIDVVQVDSEEEAVQK